MVQNEGDVKPRRAVEGDVSAGEEIESFGLKSAFCCKRSRGQSVRRMKAWDRGKHLLFGTANSSRPSRLRSGLVRVENMMRWGEN